MNTKIITTLLLCFLMFFATIAYSPNLHINGNSGIVKTKNTVDYVNEIYQYYSQNLSTERFPKKNSTLLFDIGNNITLPSYFYYINDNKNEHDLYKSYMYDVKPSKSYDFLVEETNQQNLGGIDGSIMQSTKDENKYNFQTTKLPVYAKEEVSVIKTETYMSDHNHKKSRIFSLQSAKSPDYSNNNLLEPYTNKYNHSNMLRTRIKRIKRSTNLSPREIAKELIKKEGIEMPEVMARIDQLFESEFAKVLKDISLPLSIPFFDFENSMAWLIITRRYHRKIEKVFPNIHLMTTRKSNEAEYVIPTFTNSIEDLKKKKEYEESLIYFLRMIVGCEKNIFAYVKGWVLRNEPLYPNGKNIVEANKDALFKLMKILNTVTNNIYVKADIIRIFIKFRLVERIPNFKDSFPDLFPSSNNTKLQGSTEETIYAKEKIQNSTEEIISIYADENLKLINENVTDSLQLTTEDTQLTTEAMLTTTLGSSETTTEGMPTTTEENYQTTEASLISTENTLFTTRAILTATEDTQQIYA